MQYPDESSFEAALQQFRREGLGDAEIFSRLMRHIGHEVVPGTRSVMDSPLRRFLLAHISQSPQFIYPPIGYAKWGEERALIYLQLLEEVRTDLALEYVLDQVLQHPQAAVPFFITYRDGHYIPFIMEDISRTESYSREVAESKVQAAIQLYEADQDVPAAVLEDAARQYLRFDQEQGWKTLEKIAGSSAIVRKIIKDMKDRPK